MPATQKPRRRPSIVVRGSAIHGKGVFATRAIAKGERIIEYKGKLITEEAADERYGDDESNHTFLFLLDNDMVIDAYRGGNSARWINHSCHPNCEPVEEDNRLYIHAIRDIKPDDELSYEYNLVIEDRYTPAIKRLYACRCGTPKCQALSSRQDASVVSREVLYEFPFGLSPSKASASRSWFDKLITNS